MLDIPPKVVAITRPFAVFPTYLSIAFEGSYGKTFGLEKSENLSNWESSGFNDATMSITNSASFSFYMDESKRKMFYRVVER